MRSGDERGARLSGEEGYSGAGVRAGAASEADPVGKLQEGEEVEEVTPANSPFDLHLKQMGLDANEFDHDHLETIASSPHPPTGRKIASGDIVWRDGVFLDDAEARSAPVAWWRRLSRWAPFPIRSVLRSLKTKMRCVWSGSPTSPDWLQICVRFFGFTEQLKTYMSRVHFHMFDRMIGVGFESVLTEEDEHFMRNYWDVEKEKQNQLNRELRKNGMLHPTMIRLGVVLWASLSYLFHQYVFSTGPSSIWVPAIFIVCFLILLTPESITMWQHRLAVRRADASLAAFEAYLAQSKELASTTRLAMKLIHELEFVEAGFSFVPSASGVDSATSGRQWTEQLVVLKGSVFLALRHLFHSHRAATRDLMLALPLGADLDTPALYIAHIPLAEFGASLSLPCVAGNEQHLLALRQSTDDFASSALKAMAQLAHLQSSEFVRRLILSASPQAFDMNSSSLVTDITVSFCRNLAKDLIPTISSLRRSYDFHRCQILARESAAVAAASTATAPSPSAVGSTAASSTPRASLAAALHALDLRLQSALLRSREVEETCKMEPTPTKEGKMPHSATSDADDQSLASSSSSLRSLERLGLEIDAAKAIWEDALEKAKALVAGTNVVAAATPSSATTGVIPQLPSSMGKETDQLPEVHQHVVVDEVFEGVVDEEEARRRKRTTLEDDYDDDEYASAAEEERQKRKKEKEEMKRLLTELGPKLKERADMWEEREKKAMEDKGGGKDEATREGVGRDEATEEAGGRRDEAEMKGGRDETIQAGGRGTDDDDDDIALMSPPTQASRDGATDEAKEHNQPGDRQISTDPFVKQRLEDADREAVDASARDSEDRVSHALSSQMTPLARTEDSESPDAASTQSSAEPLGPDASPKPTPRLGKGFLSQSESRPAPQPAPRSRLRPCSAVGAGVEAPRRVSSEITSGAVKPTTSARGDSRSLVGPPSSVASSRSNAGLAAAPPVAPVRDRRRREKLALARWRSETDIDGGAAGGGGGAGDGGMSKPGSLVRVSWVKSMEMLHVKPTRVDGCRRSSTDSLRLVGVDIDIGEPASTGLLTVQKRTSSTGALDEGFGDSIERPQKETGNAMAQERSGASRESVDDARITAKEAMSSEEKEIDTTDVKSAKSESILTDSALPVLDEENADLDCVETTADDVAGMALEAMSALQVSNHDSSFKPAVDRDDRSSVASTTTEHIADSMLSSHPVVDLLIVNGGDRPKEVGLGIETKFPASTTHPHEPIVEAPTEEGSNQKEGMPRVEWTREKSLDVDTDSSSSSPVNGKGQEDCADRPSDSSHLPAPLSSLRGPGLKIPAATTIGGHAATSLDRSRPSSLAGCLASPPARGLDLANGSFAYNKNLAQMAVAKSAEFRVSMAEAGSQKASVYVEETFGDDSSSAEDDDSEEEDAEGDVD